ncbi:MAG TPA: low-specificity L-threonine aldolase [Bacillota bacterium]|nr:low-specificity L-threonine aldolase [Bacillota bacterium]HQL37597.1 low-specificity L-threonine aldolase [Bacillota bacterium]
MRYIDLRSDTVTQPTDEMREAMAKAIVGDDVYGDDPTVCLLEKKAAEYAGKEAALFVPSGTMGNQLAVMTHTKRGNEIIAEENCHIIQHEVGAVAILSSAMVRTIRGEKGVMNPQDVLNAIRGNDIHYPETGLICMENALSNGTVVPLEVMKEIYTIARNHNIPVHLDGARLFNAAAYLGVDAAQITQYTDSVMFCLSKGMCAPVGSMLAGSKEFIEKARKNRKILGGGMRQAGILAAAGLIALEKMSKRLHIDHENAKYLAERLMSIPGIKLDYKDVQIDMVFFDMEETGISSDKLVDELFKKGIKINGAEGGLMRFVTNNDVTREDIDYTVQCIKELVQP